MRPSFFLLACACLALGGQGAVSAAEDGPLLSPVFSDGMVIQYGQPVPVWGHARPDAAVEVTLNAHSQTVTANADGRWSAMFDALADGAPVSLTVRSGARQTRISDARAGEVWLCAGQSNMEFPVSRALNPDTELATADDPGLKLLTIPHTSHIEAVQALPEGAAWAPSTPETAADFSAVCYFFGRERRARTGLPVGLVNASWGGSQIEAWMSAVALRSAGVAQDGLDLLALYVRDPEAGMARYGDIWEAWWTAGSDEPLPWNDTASSWAQVPDFSDWRGWPDEAMRDHLGMVWYQTRVDLSAEQAASPATLSLGGIDEIDAAWVNGRFLSGSFGWGTPRTYTVPAGLLQAGENTLTVNVYNSWGAGGMIGPASDLALTFDDAQSAPLDARWTYQRVDPARGAPPAMPWQSIGGLTGLHNAMIAPLGPIALAGALWYQGESNTGHPETYEVSLAALLAGWREQFTPDLPVIVIQLANYGALREQPVQSGWAAVRDAQRRVAEADPRTGLVVTIDIGDRLDIHPPNKQAAAARASRTARFLDGEMITSPWGPRPLRAHAQGNTTRVEFTPDSALVVVGGAAALGFELCDEALACRFAPGRLAGRSVIVLEEGDGAPPARVRYGWADAPILNLYAANGLPVGPFELELD
ncbi:MAG: beta galactosidase jelly roll domain-containing protein [Oceanicaulis sp.]|nr:beta galactosidase jelly roll domain-containing protein [Oceanicaulis sp.]